MSKEFYITKDTYSDIMDRLNKVVSEAKDPSCGKEDVIKELRNAQLVIENRMPTRWYIKRDSDIDNVCSKVRECNNIEERLEVIQKFYEKFLDKLYNSEIIELEP